MRCSYYTKLVKKVRHRKRKAISDTLPGVTVILEANKDAEDAEDAEVKSLLQRTATVS
jgi:hypothetical protein